MELKIKAGYRVRFSGDAGKDRVFAGWWLGTAFFAIPGDVDKDMLAITPKEIAEGLNEGWILDLDGELVDQVTYVEQA